MTRRRNEGPVQLRVEAIIDAADLAYYEEGALIEFVKQLDENVGSWDFTLALCDYFDEQRKVHAAETAAVEAAKP